MRLKYEKVIHHAIVNNLFGLESMKKSCNAQGSSKYYLFVTASFLCYNGFQEDVEMIKEIVKDNFFLSQVAEKATKEDLYIGTDLKDTLQAHLHECVGMAGNMIGYNKAVIIFLEDEKMHVMYNPEIIKTSGNYHECEEGCLSHVGQKSVKRYETIKVSYFDESFKKKIKTYTGFTAQIIQHECDHLKGILI